DNQAPGPVLVAALIDHDEVAGTVDRGYPSVVLNAQASSRSEVAQIAHQIGSVRKVALRVAGKEQLRIFTQQRVPVHPQVELRVRGPRVRLVDRYQAPVARVLLEEGAGP